MLAWSISLVERRIAGDRRRTCGGLHPPRIRACRSPCGVAQAVPPEWAPAARNEQPSAGRSASRRCCGGDFAVYACANSLQADQPALGGETLPRSVPDPSRVLEGDPVCVGPVDRGVRRRHQGQASRFSMDANQASMECENLVSRRRSDTLKCPARSNRNRSPDHAKRSCMPPPRRRSASDAGGNRAAHGARAPHALGGGPRASRPPRGVDWRRPAVRAERPRRAVLLRRRLSARARTRPRSARTNATGSDSRR